MEPELSTFSIGWFDNDGDIARRALSGQPIDILPRTPFYDHWGVRRHVGDAGVDQFVDNWKHRMTRGIRRHRVAIKQEHAGPAMGWYTSIEESDVGVAARMAWNNSGREFLEAGGYAYFSPEVAWRMRDSIDNSWVDNQIVGGGFTNDPYLGEQTALMSHGGTMPQVRHGLLVYRGGLLMPPQNDPTQSAGGDDLNAFAQGLARLFAVFGRTPPGDAAPATNGGADLSALTTQVTSLTQQVEQVVSENTNLTQQRDDAMSRIKDLTGRIDASDMARQVSEFRAVASQQFAHLPGTPDQWGTQLYWLHTLDPPNAEGVREHFEFFRTVFLRADEVMAEAFSSRGKTVPTPGSVVELMNGKIAAYKTANPQVAHDDAEQAVFSANPNMYGQYLTELDRAASKEGK